VFLRGLSGTPSCRRGRHGRRNPYTADLPTSTEGVIRGAPRQQEQKPAGFHGGLPAHLFPWRPSMPCHAMPCQRSCCRAPSPTAVGPSPPAIVTPHQAHELRGGSKTQYGDARRGCKLGTAARARRRPRPGAPRNIMAGRRTQHPKGGRYLKYRPPPCSSHPSDRSSVVKIRSTGIILVRHLFALLGGKRLPTMARARPRLFRCSRTHSCPRRALDACCSTASCYRRHDRQDITQAQNLHAWERYRCSCNPWRAAPAKLAPCTPLFLSFPGSSAATLLRLHLPN